MDDKMINLGGVSICFKANAVENKDARIIAEKTLEVKGHLLFSSTACLGEFVVRLKRVKFLDNHSDYGIRLRVPAIVDQ